MGDPAAAGALHIHQDVALLAAYLDAGCPSFYHLAAGRGAYLVPTRGTIEVNGTPAAPRSGTAVSRVDALTIRATDAAEIVLMDLPRPPRTARVDARLRLDEGAGPWLDATSIGGAFMADFQTLQEIAHAARANLAQSAWDYLTGGGESETTLKRNRLGLDSIGLRPRVCRDVTQIDCSTEFLGQTVRLPVCIAPMGSLQLLEPAGADGVVRAADEFGIPAFLSSLTEPQIEDIGPQTNRPMVYQIYVRGDDSWVATFVKRAVNSGCGAVCFTVDLALYGRRERDLMKRYRPPTRQAGDLAAFHFQTAWNWDNVKRFKDAHDIPLIIKGIATAEDAEIAVEHGVDVIYVSNHGGRQLDHGCATIDVLPEVAAAVAGRAKIMIDGGFMRGTDVVKAIALGAHAVGLGKLIGMGLAGGGREGVLRTLEILEEEITTALGLMGVTRFDELGSSFLRSASPVVQPHLLSPFPFINFTDKGY